MGAILDGTFTYPLYEQQPDRAPGLGPEEEDRRYAALLMFVEQLLTLGTCIVWLLLRYLRQAAGQPESGSGYAGRSTG